MGKVPLGPSKPSRVPAPPATRTTPTSPAASPGADLGGPPPGHTLAVGLGQPHHLDRPHVVQVHVGGRLAAHQLADQPVQLGKVQAFQLAKQPRLLYRRQVVPPRQQVTLRVPIQSFDQVRVR